MVIADSYSVAVKNVARSWRKVKKISNYEEVFGKALFDRLFFMAPETRQLFSFDTTSSKRFLLHATAVVRMLDQAIHLLVRGRIEALNEALRRLGVRHCHYGVTSDHYDIVGEALLFALKSVLGENAYKKLDVECSWSAVDNIIFQQMMEAACLEEM